MLQLHNLQLAAGAKKKRKRVGRGDASGHGSYSGRGIKGQKSRSGGAKGPGFEGGQTPLAKRLPKIKGFKSFKPKAQVVNLRDLNKNYKDQEQVTPKSLKAKGLVSGLKAPIKILGQGKVNKVLKIQVEQFSKSAENAIIKAGGSINKISKLKTRSSHRGAGSLREKPQLTPRESPLGKTEN